MNKVLGSTLVATALMMPFAPASAQTDAYPSRAVRLIVSFSPGGSVDTTARILSQALSERLKQPFVIENKPGADGNIAAEFVARAQPDGHTLLVTSNALSITPALKKLPFDPVSDLKAISRILSIPNLLVVHPSLPVASVRDLIAHAKSRPEQLAFASSGTGTTPFMGMALMMTMTGIRMNHIPYKGTAPAVTATLSGQTQLMFGDVNSLLPQVRGGKLKAIGISSLQRSELAQDIPTISESGMPGFDTSTWVGMLAPANTQKVAVDVIQREVAASLKTSFVQERVRSMGAQLHGDSPEEFSGVIKSDIVRWTQVVKELGVTPD